MSVTQNTIKNVDVAALMIREGFNTRPDSDPDYIRALAVDIKDNGIQTPIQVEPVEGEKDKYYIVAGHGRLAAVQYANDSLGAGIKAIPAIVKRGLDDVKRDSILLSDRFARQLEPIAYAKAMQRMMERDGITQSQFAEKYGITVAYAGDLKLLANAPAEVQQAVEDGVISSTEAVRTIKEYGEEGATQIAHELTEEAKHEPSDPEQSKGKGWYNQEDKDSPENTPAVKRAKKSKKDTERVAKNKGIATKKTKAAPPSVEEQEKISLVEFSNQAAAFMDTAIGHMKADNMAGVRRAMENMGNLLRAYQRSGYTLSDPVSGITANTTDEELLWATEPNG